MNETKIKDYKIEVFVKTMEKDGRKFKVFSAVRTVENEETKETKKQYITLKFTKEVNNKPERHCFITVPSNKINLDTRGEYPVFWINEIKDIEIIYPDYSKYFNN